MCKRVINRVRKEFAIRENIKNGFSRRAASQWYNKEKRDTHKWEDVYPKRVLKEVHKRGFLAESIEDLHLLENANCDRISDRDYFYLQPLNSSFSKWIEDMNTMSRMFPQHSRYFLKIYYSLIHRDETMVLQYPNALKPCSAEDIVVLLKEKQKLQVCPAFWASKAEKYDIDYCDAQSVCVNGAPMRNEDFYELVESIKADYLVCDRPDYACPVSEGWDHPAFLKVYVANDCGEDSKILCALAEEVTDEECAGRQYPIEVATGQLALNDLALTVNNWENVKRGILDLASDMKQISFFTVSVVLCDGGFKIIHCSALPQLPRNGYTEALDEYLKERVRLKKAQVITPADRKKAFKISMFTKFVRRFCKPGIRPYMQRLWFDSVKNDLKYKGTTLGQKLWAWKRGFLSYRIKQYGLTEQNYKNFLSDYQYHWLNRINNVYQKWVNDKTSFRAVMTPFKEYIPDYYFSVYKEHNAMRIVRMQDCPDGVPCDYTGVCRLLREQGKLVFKPSAGTHGDGFYCLAYDENGYYINGEPTTEKGIDELLKRQKSFYIVTSYIKMHPDLKKIYPQSVNSIRIMVINRDGYNPKIMQTYMRIGSSKTGFTDNVGYGGICAMINMETGVMYDPESLRDHMYYPCPKHPDTGTEIAGIKIPHWDLVCRKVVEICRMMPELEYLGFDIAVTEDAFNVMEINIHQDLHKVALHSDEIRAFYADKIRYKEMLYSRSEIDE